jgi:hypothetical protein
VEEERREERGTSGTWLYAGNKESGKSCGFRSEILVVPVCVVACAMKEQSERGD